MDKTKISDLTDEELEVLRKHNEEKKKLLLAQLSEVNSRIERYGGSIKSKTQTALPFANGFPMRESKPAKILFIIKELGKFSSVYDIIHRMAMYVPSVLNGDAIDKGEYRTIYGAILHKCKTGDFVRIKDEQQSVYRYGLPEWVDDKNFAKSEYL